MSRQISVRMPDRLVEELDRQAEALQRGRSEVIRLAVQSFLERSGSAPATRPIDRVRDLLGSYESGIPDLGQRHRDHLLQRLRRGR